MGVWTNARPSGIKAIQYIYLERGNPDISEVSRYKLGIYNGNLGDKLRITADAIPP